MEKIKAFCVKYGALILIFIMCLMLRGCIDLFNDRQSAAPVEAAPETAASDTPAPTRAPGALIPGEGFVTGEPGIAYSADGVLRVEQRLVSAEEGGEARSVHVAIVNARNGLTVWEFDAGLAMNYGGVCWAKEGYDLWVYTFDGGFALMRYEDGAWTQDPWAFPPEDIATRAGGAGD